MKHLLPTIPIKWVGTSAQTGTYAARTWYAYGVCGYLSGLYQYKDYLPQTANIFHTGAGTASTNLSVDNYNSIKFRAKWIQRHSIQNVSNMDAYVTVHVLRFRKDTATTVYSGGSSAYNILLDDTTPAAHYQTNVNSALPATSYISQIYNYPQFTIFDSSKTCSYLQVLKTRKLKVGPGETFHVRVATKSKEFSQAYLIRNNAVANPDEYVGGWSKVLWLTWHGPNVMKAGDVTSTTLGACDFITYTTNCVILKAVATHTPSKVFAIPSNLISSTPLAWAPVIRPRGVIQVTETSTAAEEKG